MFTGIVEGLGTITGLRPTSDGRRLAVAADFSLSGTQVGDSICVNGACLTAVQISARCFEADVSPETLEKTAFKHEKIGSRVNLERALRLSDRLDGHLVAGHVDTVGRILSVSDADRWRVVSIAVPPDITRYIINKGSVAVDGISLTVNHCGRQEFSVAIIPHTGSLTTLGFKPVGALVNIETDMIGKYVERLLSTDGNTTQSSNQRSSIDMNLLARTGFLNP